MQGCIFCEIIAGSIPGSHIHQDETCTAFMDLYPINPGHLLVVPNAHVSYLDRLNPATGAHIFKIAQVMAAALRRSSIKCEAINLFLADGEVAGQEVFHVHLHVVPRYKGDGFGFRFRPGYPSIRERDKLDYEAGLIQAALINDQSREEYS
jgi:histidine triad (HIT) family protein